MRTLIDSILKSKENIRMIIKYKRCSNVYIKLTGMRKKFETLNYSKEMRLGNIRKVVLDYKIFFKKKYIPILTDNCTNDPELSSFIDDYTSTIIQSVEHNRTSANSCDYRTIHDVILGVADILMKPDHTKYRHIFDEDFDRYEGMVLVFKELLYYQFYKNRKLFK